jgi:excisionase family DNA binding protein
VETIRKTADTDHTLSHGHGGPRFVKVRQAATELGCSIANVYALLNKGELPFVSVGQSKGYRIDTADIARFVSQRKVQREGAKPRVPRPQLKHIKL